MLEPIFTQVKVARNPSERKEEELIKNIKLHIVDFNGVSDLNALVAHFRAEIKNRDDMLRRELKIEEERCEQCKFKKNT